VSRLSPNGFVASLRTSARYLAVTTADGALRSVRRSFKAWMCALSPAERTRALVLWTKHEVPNGFFEGVDDEWLLHDTGR